jgi:hypothetical protein
MTDELERMEGSPIKKTRAVAPRMSPNEEKEYLEVAKKYLNSPEGLMKLSKFYTPALFKRLLELTQSPNEAVALNAIKELLLRGHGSVTVAPSSMDVVVTDDDIEKRIAKARSKGGLTVNVEFDGPLGGPLDPNAPGPVQPPAV